jgi:hypothetical protein
MNIILEQIAHARSGDKGPGSNAGVIFKNPKVYTWALNYLTIEKVKSHFSEIAFGEIKRYELDNLLALNFILGDSLGGGGSESLKNDAQGKTHGQAMLQMVVDLPAELAEFAEKLPTESELLK